MSEITHQDVLSLHEDSTPEKRAMLAQKIGYGLQHGYLSDTEKDLAFAICQQLSKDAEMAVRVCLAQHVRKCNDLPSDVALQIAMDVIDVSYPFLEISTVLSDENLIEVSNACGEAHQLAICKRNGLSEAVTDNLARVGSEIVISSMVRNKSAEISDTTFEIILDRFQESDKIHAGIVHRGYLSAHIISKLVDLVADDLKAYLITHHQLSYIQAEKLILLSREDAKNRILHAPHKMRNTPRLVQDLKAEGKLTDDLIFRSLELGDRTFFEYAMAERVNIPVENVRRLIRDEGPNGFPALYKRAKMPKDEFNAINFMVEMEYHSQSNRAISSSNYNAIEPQNWLNETDINLKKKKLF